MKNIDRAKILASTAAAALIFGLPIASSATTTKKDIVETSTVVSKAKTAKFGSSRSAANDLTRTVRADITSKAQPFSGADLSRMGPALLGPNMERGFNEPPVNGSPNIAGPYSFPVGATQR